MTRKEFNKAWEVVNLRNDQRDIEENQTALKVLQTDRNPTWMIIRVGSKNYSHDFRITSEDFESIMNFLDNRYKRLDKELTEQIESL